MRIAVIDCQPTDRDYIAALVSRWAKDRDTAVTAVPFPSAEAFLFAYSEDRDFDICIGWRRIRSASVISSTPSWTILRTSRSITRSASS